MQAQMPVVSLLARSIETLNLGGVLARVNSLALCVTLLPRHGLSPELSCLKLWHSFRYVSSLSFSSRWEAEGEALDSSQLGPALG